MPKQFSVFFKERQKNCLNELKSFGKCCSSDEGMRKITVPRDKDNTTASSQMFDLSPDITITYNWMKSEISKYVFVLFPFVELNTDIFFDLEIESFECELKVIKPSYT